MELFFDLDGTLTNPVTGIIRCFHYALKSMGRKVPGNRELESFIGPPLRETFSALISTEDEDTINLAVSFYRERFAKIGLFENEVYPEIVDCMSKLRKDGHQMWIVTSKPQIYAQRIAEHFNLSQWFNGIYGAELSGKNVNKADLIKNVLFIEQLDPKTTWMIGDRAQDVIGGRKNGIGTIGVLWGFGSKFELDEASPDIIVNTIKDLYDFISSKT